MKNLEIEMKKCLTERAWNVVDAGPATMQSKSFESATPCNEGPFNFEGHIMALVPWPKAAPGKPLFRTGSLSLPDAPNTKCAFFLTLASLGLHVPLEAYPCK